MSKDIKKQGNKAQTKQQNKSSKTSAETMEAYDIPDKEFKIRYTKENEKRNKTCYSKKIDETKGRYPEEKDKRATKQTENI